MAENDSNARADILSSLYWKRGKAEIIGITGPPGCGKSTLITQLAKLYRQKGLTVGIVAVDPSSHISGGALLGDRIRMGDLVSDRNVFIRSMATRGYSGGVARATEDVVKIMDAASMNRIIVETAGAGQSDVDVKHIVHTTVVVTAPGLGDEIQALKAGIMEIGDIFVVNKADRENSDRTAQEIQAMIMMSSDNPGWEPRVIKTIATTGQGVEALVEAIHQHSEYLHQAELNEVISARIRRDLLDSARIYFDDVALPELEKSREYRKLTKEIEIRRKDPVSAGRMLVKRRMKLHD